MHSFKSHVGIGSRQHCLFGDCLIGFLTSSSARSCKESNISSFTGTLGSVMGSGSWGPSQYTKRRLFVRSREVSKPRDWYFKLLYRFEIWQAHRQHCCRSACQISERSDNSKYKSRGFETLRDLTERRLFGYWDGALTVLFCSDFQNSHYKEIVKCVRQIF